MDLLHSLLVLSSVKLVFTQTCSKLELPEMAHSKLVSNNDESHISCLPNLSLEKCALECLLVKMCKSLNYIQRKTAQNRVNTICELNSLNHNDVGVVLKDNFQATYVDIRNWPREVAGTCDSRPCAENQRCLQTTPYRCIDIDCGIHPVERMMDGDTYLQPIVTNTSLGSRVYFRCIGKETTVSLRYAHFPCLGKVYKNCNSDSTWSQSPITCV